MSNVRYEAQLWQGGAMVARVDAASPQDAEREIAHYAAQYL